MTEPVQKPTQTKYPWRTTARTVFQAGIGLLALVPVVVTTSGVDSTAAGVTTVLAVTGGLSRVMALPGVNSWLERFLPFLAAEPSK